MLPLKHIVSGGRVALWPMLKGTNRQHSGHMVNNFQTELMVEIDSKSLVEAIWLCL